jgi:CRP/FNR family transcriptional regulator, cyclic AMP receptor protein
VEEFLLRFGLSDDEACQEFFSLFTEKKVAAGDILFDYNDPADEFYLLTKGHLAVHKFTGFLKKMQVIALLDPGAVVGEGAILEKHVRNTRVTAIEESSLLGITKKDFFSFNKRFPENGSQILEYLLSIVSLRLEKTSARLARIL